MTKTTPWFDGSKDKPVHVGPYRTRLYLSYERYYMVNYQHWDGREWGLFSATPKLAYRNRHVRSALQANDWCGLTEPAI